jgi:3-oxoacyl-[acyl-carrier-protein] synthase II
MSNVQHRVVITGLGVVSPLGRDLDSFWNNLSQRRSGIGLLETLPLDVIPVKYGGQASCFTGDIGDFGPLEKNLQRAIKKNQKVMCREIEMGVAACQLALHHAGLADPTLRTPDRFGIVYGSDYIITRPEEFADGISACLSPEMSFQMPQWPTVGRPQVNPLWLLKYLPNMPASHVAIYNDLRGPSNSVTIREASSGASIVEALSAIRRGAADVMIAGATGSRMEPLRALNFMSTEPMASEQQDPTRMARPYDITRDGNLIGEGAGALVLESMERAVARGAKIWGEVIGGCSSAVGNFQQRDPNRDSIRLATSNVLRGLLDHAQRAGLDLNSTPWHIHGCGKSDVQGDASEASGIRDALGSLDVPVTAAKSYFGNLGAGSGAVEIIASCLALERQSLFPVLNTTTVDPRCPIHVATGKESPGDAFAHLAYSSQGQACGVLIRRVA